MDIHSRRDCLLQRHTFEWDYIVSTRYIFNPRIRLWILGLNVYWYTDTCELTRMEDRPFSLMKSSGVTFYFSRKASGEPGTDDKPLLLTR